MSNNNLDAILAAATPPQETVRLCVNGKLRREYEQVKARIDERAEAAAAARAETRVAAAARDIVDDRLGVKAGTGPDDTVLADETSAGPDPEQELLDSLIKRMEEQTITFVLEAVGEQEWNELVERHPPRKDPTTGRVVQEDAEDLVNKKTFYPELVRRAVVEPVFTDAQWARLVKNLSVAQAARLKAGASVVNLQDDALPF